MVSTRRFTNEEQQILEDFIKSDKIYDLVSDKIYDTKKCKKWVNENLKIKDALDKNLNHKGELSIKDKFLWILSDIINCQIDEKTPLYHKQINMYFDIKNLLISLGIYGKIEGIKNIESIDFIENNTQLEEIGKTYLNHYSIEKKKFTPLNRFNLILKEIDKNNNSFLDNLCSDEDIGDLISYIEEEKIPTNFKELEEEKSEKRGVKRKCEDEYQDKNNNIATEKEVYICGKISEKAIFDLEYE